MTPEQEELIKAWAKNGARPGDLAPQTRDSTLRAVAQVVLELAAKAEAPLYIVPEGLNLRVRSLIDHAPTPEFAEVDEPVSATFTASPDWDSITPDLLVAARFIEENDNASLSNGTARNIASILRGLVAFHTGPASPRPQNSDADERYGAHEAEMGSCGGPSSDTGSRARLRVRHELAALIDEGFNKMVGSSNVVDCILDVLQKAHLQEHRYRSGFIERVKVADL